MFAPDSGLREGPAVSERRTMCALLKAIKVAIMRTAVPRTIPAIQSTKISRATQSSAAQVPRVSKHGHLPCELSALQCRVLGKKQDDPYGARQQRIKDRPPLEYNLRSPGHSARFF